MKTRLPIRSCLLALILFCAHGAHGAGDSPRVAPGTVPDTQCPIGHHALKPYPPILIDFAPTLAPVQVLPDPGAPVVTREGKGRLEVYPDGRRVLFLKGTPREMGFQHGKLLGPEVRKMCDTVLVTGAALAALKNGEDFIGTLRKILDRCRPHIPSEYIEEAQGLAEGAGLKPDNVMLANIFPERFHCSGFALWGKATADGKLYHGRVLDYMNEIGLQTLAVVMVIQPEGGIPWVNVGYAGFLGSVTGMNAKQVAVGEMGGGGEGKWDGMPMSYLVRRVLERAGTLEEALKIFRETPRTCEYYYVVSDGKGPDARGLAAVPERLEEVKPGEKHERLPYPVEDAVLLSADDRYKRLVMRTKAHYGSFDAAEALALMRRPVAMESCLHAALFCPSDGRFWVADAAVNGKPASEQPYKAYDLKKLLKSAE